MPDHKRSQSDRQPAAAADNPLPSSAAQDTKRSSDSTPMATGTFAKIPMRFGRYQVEKLLGRGAMGAVYLARDTQLERLVALKIPKLSGSGAARLLARLKTEAKAAAQIDHPSVCSVYDAGDIDGTSYIAMQYVEGETLKADFEKQAHTPTEVVNLVLHLAEGLAEAHSRGIYHRDLKPENIKLNRRGIPVIMDFGLAKLTATVTADAGKTQSGAILGSPAYMSPEQASGKTEEIDHRSDLYALGVMLFEMLTGQWPFTGAALQVMGQKSVLEPPSPLTIRPELNPRLATLCHKLIARQREDRYQTAQEVIAALKALDMGTGTQGSASSCTTGQSPSAIPTPLPALEQDDAFSSLIARKRQEAGSAASMNWLRTMLGSLAVLRRSVEMPRHGKIGKRKGTNPSRKTRIIPIGLAVAALVAGIIVCAIVAFSVKKDGITIAANVSRVQSDNENIFNKLDDPARPAPEMDAGDLPTSSDMTQEFDEKQSESEDDEPQTQPEDAASLDGPPAESVEPEAAEADEPEINESLRNSDGDTKPDSAKAARNTGRADPIETARNKFASDVKKAEENLLSQFTIQIGLLVKSKMNLDQRNRMTQALKTEETYFKSKRLLPWSAPMRIAAIAYLKELGKANADLRRQFDRQIAATKTKDAAKAELLLSDSARLTAPKLVGAWKQTSSAPPVTQYLYSDGTFKRVDVVDGVRRTWILQHDVLITTAFNPANGQVWVNRCLIGPEGDTYSGVNSNNVSITGQLDRDAN